MNCIIVDDEPLAQNLLVDFINKVPFLSLTAKCKSAFEATEVITSEKVDLIFLDIHMPDISGIDFIKNTDNLPGIIFTTAYSHYAIEGFEYNAVDYLLKPISFERFTKAVNRAYEEFKLKSADTNNTKTKDYIFVKSDYKLVKINFNDILYIEGLKDYIKIITKEKTVLTLMRMKNIEEKLPSDNFFRIHRSYIISINNIDSVNKSNVYIGEKNIPVSDFYRESFLKFINYGK